MIEMFQIAIPCITTIAGFIIAVVQAVKTKNKSKLVELAKIVQKIPIYIEQAEQVLGAGTGKAKLQYVLNQLKVDCTMANIEYDEQGLTTEIENILKTPQKKIGE